MADRKISDLTALTTPASGDFLPIVDISEAAAASKNKKITYSDFLNNIPTGTITSTMILDGTILNADINASAAIVDTKLATIATGGKVSNSATTATDANTASAIVARDASGNFSAGTITAALTGAASSNVLKAGDTMTGALEVIGTAGTISARATTGVSSQVIQIYNNGTDSYIDSTAYGAGSGGGIAFRRNGTGEMGRFDTSGRLLVGTSTARSSAPLGTGLHQVESATFAISQLFSNSATVDGSYIGLWKSRGGTVGSTTIVQSGDVVGGIYFGGSDGTNLITNATITSEVDGTPGANDMPGRLVFSTTADGAASPTERMRISNDGKIFFNVGVYNTTTALAANMHLDAAPVYGIYRSTSSIKYKTDVEDIDNAYADAILGCRPVWYRSLCERDPKDHSYWGFIAEEVAQIDPRLVFWKTSDTLVNQDGTTETIELDEPEAENVAYDRFVPLLLNLIKRQKEQIETQGAAIAALETRLSALGAQ
jgi:hypothetical protein